MFCSINYCIFSSYHKKSVKTNPFRLVLADHLLQGLHQLRRASDECVVQRRQAGVIRQLNVGAGFMQECEQPHVVVRSVLEGAHEVVDGAPALLVPCVQVQGGRTGEGRVVQEDVWKSRGMLNFG